MKLDHLRYFDRLADMLSYTNAAKSLYIAQPTLSAAIKRMEQEVGLTLFRRAEGVASSVELTEQGRIFHEYVVQALERYDTGLNLALESQNESDGLLRLGTVYSMKGRFGLRPSMTLLISGGVCPISIWSRRILPSWQSSLKAVGSMSHLPL